MYKYMSAEVGLIFTQTLRVRFTQPSTADLNDPFEFRPLIDVSGTNEEFRHEVDARLTELFSNLDTALDIMEKLQAASPTPAKVPIQVIRKMLADNPALKPQIMALLEQFKNEYWDTVKMEVLWKAQWENVNQALDQALGIFSLTEDPANVVMWGHYASNHLGVVVEFDHEHPWFNQKISPSDDLRHLVRVSYVQNPHPRTWTKLTGIDVLYTKGAGWDDEREWRIIRPLKDGTEVTPGVVCFDVPPDAVRSIIFGCRTTSDAKQKIRESVAANPGLRHVRFKRASLAEGWKFEIVDI